MSRQFGLSSRPADGGVQQGGPHGATQYIGADLNSVAATPSSSRRGRLNSGGEIRQPFIDDREFATGFFLGCLVALAAVLFCIGFVGYRALIA